MSKIRRKVTVENTKTISDSTSRRPSVFERLGPSTGSTAETQCRNWLKTGNCLYGNTCRFVHGPSPRGVMTDSASAINLCTEKEVELRSGDEDSALLPPQQPVATSSPPNTLTSGAGVATVKGHKLKPHKCKLLYVSSKKGQKRQLSKRVPGRWASSTRQDTQAETLFLLEEKAHKISQLISSHSSLTLPTNETSSYP
uniref:Uncharacterized protein n=1 Tax=Sphaerodactylus townsendi TaxID=933632 RepID=A0ACB8GF92_9SAUR